MMSKNSASAQSDYLLEDLPRGVEGKTPIGPNTAWATSEAILSSEKLKYNDSKILIGCVDGQGLIGTDDDRHVMVIAGSRAGKGVSSIIPNLLNYRGSMLVIDPKSELASITAEHRAKVLGQKVYVLDPFERAAPWVKDYRASFNPMTMLQDKKRIIETAGILADALIVHRNFGDPHWDETAREVLETLILHVAIYPKYEGSRTLVKVRELLLGGTKVNIEGKVVGGLKGLLAEMMNNRALDGLISAMASSINDKPERERGGIISTAQRHTKFLDLPAIKNSLTENDFSLSGLKTDATTIYMCLPTSMMSTCNRFLRLFINLGLVSMENTLLHEGAGFNETKTGCPTVFLLDEFATLSYMRQIETAIGQIAGFSTKFMIILQDITQLQSLYEKRWETFIGNCGIIQAFGNNDTTTLEFLSKRAGQTDVVTHQKSLQSHHSRMTGNTGQSYSIQTQNLIMAEEVSRYFGRNDPKRRQLVIWAGRPPLILQRCVYHDKNLPEYKYFKGKYRDWS